VTLLAEGVRQGYEIITAEPSAALALTQEYPVIFDDPDARLVAEHTHEACDYLLQLERSGNWPHDMQPIEARVAYHEPCHLRALGVGTPGLELLRQIPKLEIVAEEHGCSGMAGTFGLDRRHFRTSVRAGWGLISAVRRSPVLGGATECSACKMQMEQGTDKPTIHPLKLLAAAYGLLPGGMSQLLSAKSQTLVVT
jgi:Fe-S oxidoreductase